MELTVSGQRLTLGPGDVGYIGSNELHNAKNVGSTRAHYFIVNFGRDVCDRPDARPAKPAENLLIRRSLRAFAIAVTLPAAAAAQEAAPPCAACVVFAIAPPELQMAGTADVPVALVAPAEPPGDVAELLSRIPPAKSSRAVPVILDARTPGPLTDEARYRLRTSATAVRAARDTSVGIELLSSQVRDGSIDALAGYIDFLVLPADADSAAVSTRLAGLPLWTDAVFPEPPSALDVVTGARIPHSEHLLLHVAADRRDLVSAIAAMRDVLPAGLTPLADVRVMCDAACVRTVFLNPQTLDAV